MVSCAGRDPYAKLPTTLGSRYEGANPAPEIRTAVGLITEAGRRPQGPATATTTVANTGDESGVFAWKTAVFAGLPKEEQVRYLCHVLGQSTLNAEESVHVFRVVSIYRQQHGDSPCVALGELPADVRKDMISRNPKGDAGALGYNYWVFNL